jgi:tellurite resistance protein
MATPPLFPPRLPLYARTPPALFPLCLGLVGLAMSWRRAAGVFDFSSAVGDVMIGLFASLFAVALALYLAKLIRRPGALRDDLRSPGGRGALAAASMTLMLLGGAFADAAEGFARALWLSGVVLQFVLAALLIDVLLHLPKGARPITPALFVPFVGQIVAPIGGAPLGYDALSAGLFVLALLVWIALSGPVAVRLMRGLPQPPVRPPLAILLAPPAIGVVAHDALPAALQAQMLGPILFWIAAVIALALLARAPWLTEGGFSPLWAAFTFPFTSFAGASLVMARVSLSAAWDAIAAGALTAATLITGYVAYRFIIAAKEGELFRAPVI